MDLTISDGFKASNGKYMILNPNTKIVGAIVSRCLLNSGYCPCGTEVDEDHKCPCKEAREEAKCHCSLYVTPSIS